MTENAPESPTVTALVTAVAMGDFIPAHDETFDIAERIARHLDRFRHYVESVRDAEQAADAVSELADAIRAAIPNPTVETAEETYSRLMDLKFSADDRITLVSVRALAEAARAEYPDAATLVLYHDTYESMEVSMVLDAHGFAVTDYDTNEGLNEDATWHHLSNLAARGRAAELAAVAPGVLDRQDTDWYRFNIDAALALPADGSKPVIEEATA